MLESAGGLCDGFSLFINIIIIIIITARPAPRSEPLSQPRGEGGKVRLGNKWSKKCSMNSIPRIPVYGEAENNGKVEPYPKW